MIIDKTCYKCGELKSLDSFHKRKGTPDGHVNICKNCRKLESEKYYLKYKPIINKKGRAYNSNNKEKKVIADSLYYEKNKSNLLKGNKIYREINKASIKTQRKGYYIDNAEKISAYKKEYYKTPQGRANANASRRKRRALKKSQWHPLNNPKIEKQLDLIRQRVEKCLGIEHALDHIWPLSKGGLHHIENLQIIPSTINQRKCDNMEFEHPNLIMWYELPEWLILDTFNRLNSSPIETTPT